MITKELPVVVAVVVSLLRLDLTRGLRLSRSGSDARSYLIRQTKSKPAKLTGIRLILRDPQTCTFCTPLDSLV